MIKPHPESDLNLNVMVVGADIIRRLNSGGEKFHFVENLLEEFLKIDKRRTPDLFIYSLLFLYSIGVIEHQGYRVRLKHVKN